MKHKPLTKITILLIFLFMVPSVHAFDTASEDFSSNETFIVYGVEEASSNEFNSTHVISHLAVVTMNSSDYEIRISLAGIPEAPEQPPGGDEPEEPISPGGGYSADGPVLVSNFTVDVEIIKFRIAKGQTKTEKLRINNTGETNLSITMEIEDLSDFLYFSEDEFQLNVGEEKEITIAATASENETIDVYTGRIIARSGSLERIVIVIIEVKEREALFDVSVFLPEEFKKIPTGANRTADIVLYNFGTLMPVDVVLTYEIRDMDSNVIDSRHETLAVEEQLFLQKSFTIPEYLEEGYYLFYVRLDYENQTATSSELFTVFQYSYFDVFVFVTQFWQIIVGSMIGLTSGAFLLRKRRKYSEEDATEPQEKTMEEIKQEWEGLVKKHQETSNKIKQVEEATDDQWKRIYDKYREKSKEKTESEES